MQSITRVAIACSLGLLVAGCTKSDTPATDTAAAVAPAAMEPAPAPALALADLAGKWNMRSVPESGTDTTATVYVLNATADTSGWSLEFPNGTKTPLAVHPGGDSLHLVSGTYASPRRKGVKVKTESTWRLQGDKLVGVVIARYQTTGPDSVLRLRSEGTKAP